MVFVSIPIVLVGIYVSLYVLYNCALLLVHFFVKEKMQVILQPRTNFCIIIPAHNEELLLARLIVSLKGQDYPPDLFTILVVADNCTDSTAVVARAKGSSVLERSDNHFHGKGYAIKYALENISLDEYDAIFIVDADSVMETNAFRHLDLAIQHGARIIQCFNGVANPDESWFTRLMDVSRTISNQLLEPAKESLGLSSHLMGNGMGFTKDIITKYGWDAFTVGEDWEYYAKIVSRGERVAFAKNVQVYHQESVALRQATPQRMRWSSGRMAIAYRYGPSLLFSGLLGFDIRKMDAALPLILPNPSMGVNLNLFLLLLSIPLGYQFLIYWFSTALLIQIILFCIGVMYTKNRLQKFLAMFMAPVFLAWKMIIDFLSTVGLGRKRWVRTERRNTVSK
jgi:cellulose synthase/poly-beta-1,6-N-acetylglucosamine synthase-like glycosyltransferase